MNEGGMVRAPAEAWLPYLMHKGHLHVPAYSEHYFAKQKPWAPSKYGHTLNTYKTLLPKSAKQSACHEVWYLFL